MLWLTLHVPTIFLFLFPPMMLLFVPPETIADKIDAIQQAAADRGRALLLYDGKCNFCLASVKRLRILDVFGWIDPLDFHLQPDLSTLHPSLTAARCHNEMVLLESHGKVSGGFNAFRRLCLKLPLLWPLIPLVYLPGARAAGSGIYRWIAVNRFRLHAGEKCEANQCGLRAPGSSNG
jgi:predicted DCC family thiol-disulfide oxidoreductase YuxK